MISDMTCLEVFLPWKVITKETHGGGEKIGSHKKALVYGLKCLLLAKHMLMYLEIFLLLA